MDNETKQMFGLILSKLDGIEKRLDGIEKRQDRMEQRLDRIEQRQDRMEKRLDGIEQRLDGMEQRLDGIEKRQVEMYIMQRSLEENIKVTRAEQEKMNYMLADIQGKVTRLTEKVEEHEIVINQIRAIG